MLVRAQACSAQCYDAHEEQKAEALENVQFDQSGVGRIDVIPVNNNTGILQGFWKDSKVYLDRLQNMADAVPGAALDPSEREAHFKHREVDGEIVWPLRRLATFHGMLTADV